MPNKLLFTVVEDWEGEITVSSYGGRNKGEEKRFALNGGRRVYLVTTDHDEAQRRASLERARKAPGA